MGQSESSESSELNDSFHETKWTNYTEWTNFKDLKEGEKYKVKFDSYDFECECEMIFCYYKFRGKYGYCENCDAVFKEKLKLSNGWSYTTADNSYEYYKFISKKEYNSKIRDKYNEKVLNIVLKQIVNDDFKW
uniref:Uncharacterized protein n=1 Tax=viral metagenome TaxID=1070528 RepID=A0A6C0D9N3_9ZZZZ